MRRPTLLHRTAGPAGHLAQVEPELGVYYFDLLQERTARAFNPALKLKSLSQTCDLADLQKKVRRAPVRAAGCGRVAGRRGLQGMRC